MVLPRPLVLAGPTATGKSTLALHLAQELGGEIVTVDSMQVYRGMDIGTAKPSRAERAAVPHHLIDVAELTTSFHVAEFVRLARLALEVIQRRNRVPILCGGTGLYFRALLEGLGETPPASPAIRAELAQLDLPALLTELQRSDPVLFDTIDRANRRRVVRALEVVRLTGKPFSSQRAPWKRSGQTGHLAQAGLNAVSLGITRDRDDLRRRIDLRVDQMFAQGLVDEVKSLLPLGLANNPTASQALGYRQVLEHLAGGPSLEETLVRIQVQTRQYAKRQMTWFRRQMELDWVIATPDEPLEPLARDLAERYRRAPTGAE